MFRKQGKMLLKSICILSSLFHVSFECNTKSLKVQKKLDWDELENSTLETPHQDEERISKFGSFLNIANCSSNNISDSNLTYENNTVTPPELNLKTSYNWGGNCTDSHWEYCSCVTQWGGNYSVFDKLNPTKRIEGYHMIDCKNTTESYRIMCLRNGWTVSRCNLLCMAKCNTNLLKYWNRYVSHEGECALNQKSVDFMDLECQVEKLTLFKKLGCPSKKLECEKKNTDFILKQSGCLPTNDPVGRANDQTISCWLLVGCLQYLVLMFLRFVTI